MCARVAGHLVMIRICTLTQILRPHLLGSTVTLEGGVPPQHTQLGLKMDIDPLLFQIW